MRPVARAPRRAFLTVLAVTGLLVATMPAASASTAAPPPLASVAESSPFDQYFVNTSADTDDGTCDSFDCSLREAINAANANPGENTIQLSGNTTYTVDADLPAIEDDLSVGVSAGGCCGPSLAYIDGPGTGTGLNLDSGITRLDGVVVGDFATGVRIGDGADGSSFVNGGVGFAQFGSSPNTGDGIVVEGSDVRIGPDAGCCSSGSMRVVNNGGAGIVVTGAAERVTIYRVETHDNGGLGIDIDPTGPNANDDDDLDSGPNGLQNAPVIDTVETLGSMTNVEGTFEGTPNAVFQLEFFVATCDPSGFGEGDSPTFSGTSVVTNFDGEATFSIGFGFFGIGAGQGLTATATAEDGSTSEFSNCEPNTVVQRSDLNLAFDDESETVGAGEPERYTATVRNDGPTDATGVTFQQVLPAGAMLGRASSSVGSCSEAAGTVTCAIGSLPTASFGNTATITIDVRLNTVGTALTSASVAANEPDPDAADNSVNESTTVGAPAPTTFTVNSPNDANDGTCNASHCSLREAILAANANPGRDTIAFQLTGSQLIQPASPGLPIVTGPVVIDGTTDSDFAGSPVIVLSGTNAFGYYGLRVDGGQSEVRGLILSSWFNPALDLERWGDNVVAGNWFGLDPTGTTRVANNSQAVAIETSNNRVGGTTVADRNVISGSSVGVRVGRSSPTGAQPHDNIVEGNYIGTNAAGTAAISNTGGVVLVEAATTVVGGTAAGAGNLISGNSQDAIVVSDGGGAHAEDNRIEGNIIGLNAAGTAAIPNQQGITVRLNADRTIIGGIAPGAGNTISGNQFDGILVFSGGPDTLIAGNRVGTDPSGTTAFGNGRHGLNLGSGNVRTTVGGTTAAAANVIAFNTGAGVLLNGTAAVLGNSIHDNGGLGIDRFPIGVTPGSAGLTFPALTAVTTFNGTTTVAGTLASSSGTAFRIELFDNASCDPSGNGEGQAFVTATTVTTNASGNASFSVELASPLAIGRVVTATATTTGTSPFNSEFSACRTNAVPAPDGASGSGAAGSTTTTDTEGDGATAADPIETSVSIPAGGTPGAVTIDESTTVGPPPVGYSFFGVQAVITAPTQTAASPLVFVFTIDKSALPAGATSANTVVFRNSVPVAPCTAVDASATPDPCVFLREALAGGDIRLTVRTSAASTWNVGLSTGLPPLPFNGFFSPVDNLPTLNKVKAGSAVPVKFSLGGNRGLAIFTSGYPRSAVTTCDSTAPVDGIEETVNPGAAELTYDPLTDRYTYVWKTDKAWAGTCRQLVVQLTDGTFHRANFDFRK